MSILTAEWRNRIGAVVAPRSLAIVGASDKSPTKTEILRNLSRLSFAGSIYPVNPSRSDIFGMQCYASLDDLPEVPDAVLVATGPDHVNATVQSAGELGARAAVVLAGGFADVGDAGGARQRDLVRIAAAHHMAVLGPNCQGTVSFADRSAMYLLPVSGDYHPGQLALISQSGSVADALANNTQGVGWSHIVSTGNEAVVTAADMLAYLIEEDSCQGACLFLESIRDPELFFDACDRAAQLGKPVLVIKTGRTQGAQLAAAAHTGALATPDRLVDAAMRAHGVTRVDTLEEMLAAAAIVQAGRLPDSVRVGAVVASGGLVEMLHDSDRVVFPTLKRSVADTIDASTGPWVHASNPLDYWPTEDLDVNLGRILTAMASDPSVDTVVQVMQHVMGPTGDASHDPVYGAAAIQVATTTAKPVVVCAPVFGESVSHDDIRRHAEHGVAFVAGLDTTLKAISVLADRNTHRRRHRQDEFNAPQAHQRKLPTAGAPFGGIEALDYMREAGFDIAETASAFDIESVVKQANNIGYPVTVKIADAEILHKTEIGGVRIGLEDETAVRNAAADLLRNCTSVLVQATVTAPFAELIVGLSADEELGRFVVVGMGGVWTEILDDAVVWPVGHVDHDVAQSMLAKLIGYSTLLGARGQQPLALECAVDSIVRLDRLARRTPHLGVVDLNPLFLTPTRAIVVDALIGPLDTTP